jgi:hypothetical protein
MYKNVGIIKNFSLIVSTMKENVSVCLFSEIWKKINVAYSFQVKKKIYIKNIDMTVILRKIVPP